MNLLPLLCGPLLCGPLAWGPAFDPPTSLSSGAPPVSALEGGAVPSAVRSSEGHALARFAPTGAALWVETTDHVSLLESGLDHPLVRGFLDLPVVAAGGRIDPGDALKAGEAILGAPPLEVARDLAGAGLAFGAVATPQGARLVAVLRGTDDLDRYEDALEALIGALSARPSSAREREALDVEEAWRLSRRSTRIARFDARTLVVAQRPEDLHASLAAARGLEVHAALSAHAQDGREGGTFAWVDLARLEAQAGLGDLRAVQGDPAAHLLLGPVLTHLAGADELSARIEFGAERVTASLLGTGEEREAAAGTFPAAGPERSAVPVARDVKDWLRLEGHRNIDAFLTERTALLHAQLLPNVAEGLAGLALLTGDADDERLARVLGDEFLLVARPVAFGDDPKPDVVLPGVAVAARLSDPEENGPWILRAFQRGAALLGVERNQKGRPGILLGVEPLDPDVAGGPQIWTARIDPPEKGDLVDVQYNLAPGCVVVGDVVVLGTHVDAVRSVARRVAAEGAAVRPRSIDRITLDGRAAARLIDENAELLAMRAVLLEGKARPRAEAELATLRTLLDRLNSVTLETDGHIVPERHLAARLTIELAPR